MSLQTIAGLASFLLVLCAFLGLGLGLLRLLRVHVTPLDGIYAVAAGWGVLVTVSTLAGYLGARLSQILYGGLILGGVVFAASLCRANDRSLLRTTGVALLSLLPALVSATTFASVQYDEFGHWLPNAYYLYAHDALPTAALPNLQTGKQGYPIGIPYVTFAISVVEGAWDDRTGKLLPLALAALFAILIAAAFLKTERPSASATAVATLFTTLLNPFFDPRLAVTTYSDIPTAFLLAAMVYALWRATEERQDPRSWIIRATLTALILVQLRETNIGLVAAAVASVSMATVLAPPDGDVKVNLQRSGAIVAGILIVPLTGFLIWRMHLKLEGIGPDLMPRALSTWNWSAPRVVLSSLLTERLANNPLTGVLAITVGAGLALAAALSWRRSEGKTKRLMISVALVTMAQLALLLFSYIAVFAEDEVRRAASTWRYASQLGPLLMLTVAQTLPSERIMLWKRTPLAGFNGRFYAGAVITAVAAVQLVFAGRWRIDCVYPHVRPGYDALAFFFARVPSQASVTVINAADSLLFGDVARLARVVATRDWHEAAPTNDYVIDLTGADPELFRKGETTLRATLRRDGFAGPASDSVSIATSCQAARR